MSSLPISDYFWSHKYCLSYLIKFLTKTNPSLLDSIPSQLQEYQTSDPSFSFLIWIIPNSTQKLFHQLLKTVKSFKTIPPIFLGSLVYIDHCQFLYSHSLDPSWITLLILSPHQTCPHQSPMTSMLLNSVVESQPSSYLTNYSVRHSSFLKAFCSSGFQSYHSWFSFLIFF